MPLFRVKIISGAENDYLKEIKLDGSLDLNGNHICFAEHICTKRFIPFNWFVNTQHWVLRVGILFMIKYYFILELMLNGTTHFLGLWL